MHNSVINQVQLWVAKYNLNNKALRVLEIGSQNFNGSVRPNFARVNEYIGTDMGAGPGVDIVCDAHSLISKLTLGLFDVVVCTEMLEHDDAFWITMQNISELLKTKGTLILSARGCTVGSPGIPGDSMWEHGYPHDYWRFMPQAVPKLFALASCDLVEQVEDKQHPGFIAIGRRK